MQRLQVALDIPDLPDKNLQSDYIAKSTLLTGIEEAMLVIAGIETGHFDVVEKLDSGASRCMSGNPHRLASSTSVSNVTITGFNRSLSKPTRIGVNNDGKQEYYVSSMPRHLALLCAHAYAEDGAVILFGNSGLVLRLSDSELLELKGFLLKYPTSKHLIVKDRTYEVDPTLVGVSAGSNETSLNVIDASEVCNCEGVVEEAFSNTALRFFNTKVNVSNTTERVLTLLMTGLSFRDWYSHVKHGSLDGVPPDVDIKSLNNFEHRYGRTPDIVRLAIPLQTPTHSGLMAGKSVSRVGDRYEIDCLESDFNEEPKNKADHLDSGSTLQTKAAKLKTHGGARAAAVGVDCYSSYVTGKLLKSLANPVGFVSSLIHRVEQHGHVVRVLAADSGVMTTSTFQVMTTKVEEFCVGKHIIPEVAEPYNHARGTGSVEVSIKLIKELIRLAITLVLRNPNFLVTGFTAIDVYKLWGEFFLWAITMVNLKPCPSEPHISRYEVYHRRRPNMQTIRLLPIGSVLIVLRKVPVSTAVTNQYYSQISLYVGPSLLTPGAARVAIKVSNGQVRIIVTSNFRAASDGGGLNVFPHIERGLSKLLDEQTEEPEQNYFDNDDQNALEEKAEEIQPEKPSGIKTKIRKNKSSVTFQCPEVVSKPSDTILSTEALIDKVDISDVANNKIDSSDGTSENKLISSPVVAVEPVLTNPVLSNDTSHLRQSARQRERRVRREATACVASDFVDLETSCFADWTTHEQHNIYWSWSDLTFLDIKNTSSTDSTDTKSEISEFGYKAVTVDVPRNFTEALQDPKWGLPARTELNTLIATKAIVEIDSDLAKDAIKNQHADLVHLFPVYEEKVKEGNTVYKVRLVGDGRDHHHAGETYSATPSREELFVILHVIASLDWDYAHIDEIRAFLNAPYKGKTKAFAKFRGSNQYYSICGALYGLKTAPRDYQDLVANRLLSLNYKRLSMCQCIYIRKVEESIILILDYVDDFIFTGSNAALLRIAVDAFRNICTTTEPIWNASRVLGMELVRDRTKRIISITMVSKINDVCNKFDIDSVCSKEIPMPQHGYIIKDTEFDKLDSSASRYLCKKEIKQFLGLVGALIWISGVRLDILFSTMYLAWNTKQPRAHHMLMGRYVLAYLNTTREYPLVLGGTSPLDLHGYTDASLGTAPKGRSVVAHLVKLNPSAGAIAAKVTANQSVVTSSFEAELDGVTRGIKSVNRIKNILFEIQMQLSHLPHIWSDNESMINFIRGQGVAKGVRHMELRSWYVREKYKEGSFVLDYMAGSVIPTKLGTKAEHSIFMKAILGHKLLEG